jgi:hypothetical protein
MVNELLWWLTVASLVGVAVVLTGVIWACGAGA